MKRQKVLRYRIGIGPMPSNSERPKLGVFLDFDGEVFAFDIDAAGRLLEQMREAVRLATNKMIANQDDTPNLS